MSERTDVHAILLALADDTLLLPNAAIAEIVSAERLRKSSDGPQWHAGTVLYQERVLRVVWFEVLNGGKPPPADSRRTRIAVLHGMTGKLPTGQFALLCQGHPNLVTLNRAALKPEPARPGDREDLALSRVKIANASPVIPNLELIETEIAKLDERR